MDSGKLDSANSANAAHLRILDRVGIIPHLLTCSLLAVLLTAILVELWNLRVVDANGEQRTQDWLRQSVALLKLQLAPFGGSWSVGPNDTLLLGATPLNGRNDVVNSVTGAAATIFLRDVRIATNIANSDGTRGIGTKLAAGSVHDILLREGRSYTGSLTILGVDYLTVYEPIRDADGQIVSILSVGVPVAGAKTFMATITWQALIGVLLIATLTSLGNLVILRVTVRPLNPHLSQESGASGL